MRLQYSNLGQKDMRADGGTELATVWHTVIFATDKITEIMSMPMKLCFPNPDQSHCMPLALIILMVTK
jgi:hypothetical protein